MFEFSFDKLIFDDNREYNNHYDLFRNNIVRRINNNNKIILLFNFNKLEETLRRKKLTHFLLLYLKTFEFFKLDNIK